MRSDNNITFDRGENIENENDGENLDSPDGNGGEFLRGSDPPLLLRRTVRQHGGGVVGVEREGGLS